MFPDLAARQIRIVSVDLRLRIRLRLDEMPFPNDNGMPYYDISPLETFDEAMRILDLDAFRRQQAEARAAGRYLGLGTSSYVEPTARALGYYRPEGATLRIEPSGPVNVYVAGGSTGNSLETTTIQLTADALGADIAQVSTIQGDPEVDRTSTHLNSSHYCDTRIPSS